MIAPSLLGVILTGGTSRRMGRDKATVPLGGKTMAEWVLDALSQATDRVVTVGAVDPGLAQHVPDARHGQRGPLAGLESALHSHPGNDVLLVATDQPFVRAATLLRLSQVAGGDAVIPTDDGVLQVTCALYRASCLPTTTATLNQGRLALQALLDSSDFIQVEEETWRSWGEDGRSWYSIDAPEDIEEALRRFGRPGDHDPSEA